MDKCVSVCLCVLSVVSLENPNQYPPFPPLHPQRGTQLRLPSREIQISVRSLLKSQECHGPLLRHQGLSSSTLPVFLANLSRKNLALGPTLRSYFVLMRQDY